jgi:hypothetical protein
MSKKIFVLAILIVLAIPATTFAWNRHQIATPIVGADCAPKDKVTPDGKNYVLDADHNHIPDYDNQRCSVTVYRFTDGSNTCYVSKGTNSGGLYCVK